MGIGRGRFWVLVGVDFGSWKGQVLGPGRGGFWGWCPSARSQTATSGGGKGDCGSWKGIVGTGRGGFGILIGFGSWKGQVLGMVSISS